MTETAAAYWRRRAEYYESRLFGWAMGAFAAGMAAGVVIGGLFR